jgi:hypothetical protein
MTLALVREELVPVEQVRRGQTLVLPRGQRVSIYKVERLDDGRYVVCWRRPAERGEPGFTLRNNDRHDGFYLGSFAPMSAGECVRIDRG